jgi:hypothetical protein
LQLAEIEMTFQTKIGAAVLAFAAIIALFFGPAIVRGFVSSGWPSVDGSIDEAQVKEGTTGGRPSVREWRVFLRYHFTVDNRRYEGTRFTSTGDFYSGLEATAQSFAAEYPVSKTVRVFFDPGDPQNSLLHPGTDSRQIFVGCLILVLFSLGAAVSFRLIKVQRAGPACNQSGRMLDNESA